MTTMQELILKYLVALALLGYGLYYVHHDGYVEGQAFVQKEWSDQTAVNSTVITKALTDNATLTTKLESDHAKSQTAIDTLHRTVTASRVLLPKAPDTVCADKTPSASGSVTTTTGDKLLPATPDTTQTSLDVFVEGVDEDMQKADSIVASCKVLQGWAVGVSK